MNATATAWQGECDRATAAKLVDDFFSAWTAQDVERVIALFATSFAFADNVGGSRVQQSEVAGLRSYLSQRFALGDKFSAVRPIIPEHPGMYTANPGASFQRHVGGASYSGNAKLICFEGRLVGLQMSAE